MITDINYKRVTVQPIYEQIVKALKNEIITGKYESGYKFPPEPELANIFNTSRPTLRKSLKLLEEQGLIQQRKGRGTFVTYNSKCKYRIAIHGVGVDSGAFFVNQVYFGLHQAFANTNKEFVFIDSSKSILDGFILAGCDALLVIAPSREGYEELSSSSFDQIPMVVLNFHNGAGFDRICVDVEPHPFYLAMKYLQELGHQRVAYITREPNAVEVNQIDRNTSFRQAVRELKLDDNPELYISGATGELFYEIGRKGAVELCKMKTPPTSIVCPNTTISLGAWQGIIESQLKIPDDISIIGYDVPEWANPLITTLVQPELEISRKAGELLLMQLKMKKPKTNNFVFKVKLEKRGSCISPNQ
jgi:GntR family transcriptional regulator, arabinose operon transcriptional repressor